jgi:hypothetical protein
MADYAAWGDDRDEIEIDDGGPYNVKEYPEREIFAFGRYIKCQILNWDDGPPPPFLICHPLDQAYKQEFLATRGMGTWMHVDLRHALWLIANSKAHAITSDVGGSPK